MSSLQTILGAGGAIGKELARELHAYTDQVRLVSRHPEKINDTDQLFPADLTDPDQVDKAIAGSAVVYLVVGFKYDIGVWRANWPALMRQVIESCKKHKARLVFFDNVYMYDRDHLSHMTEETPMRPTSKKGVIRTELVQMIMDEVKAGRLTALIARSADFLGMTNSVPVELIYKNLVRGKSANWFARVDKIHNLTFVPDAARGTAILGNTPDAFNEVWHLPTDKTPVTGRQWIGLFAGALQVKPKYTVLPVWMLGVLGIFVPVMKELKEMAYQYDRDYFFDSSKFDQRFQYTPATPEAAVKAVVAEFNRQAAAKSS